MFWQDTSYVVFTLILFLFFSDKGLKLARPSTLHVPNQLSNSFGTYFLFVLFQGSSVTVYLMHFIVATSSRGESKNTTVSRPIK